MVDGNRIIDYLTRLSILNAGLYYMPICDKVAEAHVFAKSFIENAHDKAGSDIGVLSQPREFFRLQFRDSLIRPSGTIFRGHRRQFLVGCHVNAVCPDKDH
jgi:hypothetical protein